MRIDPAASKAAFTQVKPLEATPPAADQRAIIQRKKKIADAAELGKAVAAHQSVDLAKSPAARKAQHQQATAQTPHTLAHSADNPRPVVDTPPAEQPDSRVQSFLAAYGANKGDSRYVERFDLDGDGVIGFNDLNTLLSQPPEPEPEPRVFTGADLDSLLSSFNTRLGEENFNAEYDLNQDGVINFTDLNTLVNSLAPEAAAESPAAAELTGFLDAYNRREGQEGFDARFDYDSDGVVSFTDLNTLLDQLIGATER